MRPTYFSFLIAMLLFSGCSLTRELWYNAPNSTDQHLFQELEWPAAESTFDFARGSQQLAEQIDLLPAFFATHTVPLNEYLEKSATQAIVVVRRDTIVYEQYFQGMGPDDKLTSFSVSKSFVSILMAIAIEQGIVGSTEDQLSEYFPQLAGHPSGAVKLEHLLDQTSGIDFPRDSWQYYGKQLARLPDRLKQEVPPGSRFKYENGNSQLLAMIIEQRSGISIGDYFYQNIWSQIGTEAGFSWSIDSRKNEMAKAFCCLQAQARDFARVGRLFLNQGNWNGEQLVPAEWMEKSTQPNKEPGAFIRYNNQFWLENEPSGAYAAIGLYGQWIYVYPKKDIVIVRLADDNVNINAIWSEVLGLIAEQL